ncbi:MAG: hypothetical protein WC758_06960 [Candidatus Woesearchaeota archaeon]|jgi:glycerol-3-phosphate acyltransferase PlsX
MTLEKLILGVDANGGDWFGEHPSRRIMEAISLVQQDYENVDFVIFGNEEYLSKHIKKEKDYFARFRGKFTIDTSRVSFVHAPAFFANRKKTKVHMDDKNLGNDISETAVVKMLEQLKYGNINCACTMSDTAQLLQQSVKIIGMMDNLSMTLPILFQKIPTKIATKNTLWGDLGSDVNAKPEFVFEYALILSMYAKEVLGWHNPSVKILANGTELHKGSSFEIDVSRKIQSFNRQENSFKINFDLDHPYVESNRILYYESDIIVTDGRLGNAVLKGMEGGIKFTREYTKEVLDARDIAKEVVEDPSKLVDLILMLPLSITYPFAKISQRYRKSNALMDPQSYNGAPLLGLNDYVVKMHGNSTTLGIYNGLRNAIAYRKSNAIAIIKNMFTESFDTNNKI